MFIVIFWILESSNSRKCLYFAFIFGIVSCPNKVTNPWTSVTSEKRAPHVAWVQDPRPKVSTWWDQEWRRWSANTMLKKPSCYLFIHFIQVYSGSEVPIPSACAWFLSVFSSTNITFWQLFVGFITILQFYIFCHRIARDASLPWENPWDFPPFCLNSLENPWKSHGFPLPKKTASWDTDNFTASSA